VRCLCPRLLFAQVIACVDAELKKRGKPVLTPGERSQFLSYVEAHCERKSDADDAVFDTPSSVYAPAQKKRIVGE
jgi:hypothetical protein